MPYPILTLPYPSVKRLRQLLDPFELENLQKAAGHNVISGLKPAVMSYKIDSIKFKISNVNPNGIPTLSLTTKPLHMYWSCA
uniref:BPI2 domain-containing protein n=1 Tax=Panagrellus redivivus TaxID=6233 RepID=A0A7E4VS36_PANRE